MGKTITEKIFAKHLGRDVRVGEIVSAPVDRVMFMDWKCPSVFGAFEETLGQTELRNPDRVVMVSDHLGVGHDLASAQILETFKQKAKQYGVKHFYGLGRTGICHQVMLEDGLVTPGSITLGSDSHATTYGAVGAFSCGISTSETAAIMAVGELWLMVPPSIRVVLKGALPFGCYGKDVALKILSLLRADEHALYKAVEIVGDGVQTLTMDDRIAVCNMMAETGAKNAIIPVDDITEAYLKDKLAEPYERIVSDPDAVYDETFEINLDELVPLLAVPPLVYDARPVADFAGTPITRAFLATCTSGRLEELKIAARILEGRELPEQVGMVVVPASRKIYIEAAKNGYTATFAEAGAAVESSYCASCSGRCGGVLPDGAVCISTSNRNFNGRMGSFKASIYLASAATVAVSARNGCITDPRETLRELQEGGKL